MKKLINIFLTGAVFVSMHSCKKALDINANPNEALSTTPELALPQAIVATAANTVTFNNFGNGLMGYRANAGGVSGWGSYITYNYTNTDFQTLWSNTYDNLYDYQYVLNKTAGSTSYAYFNAAAKVMKAYNFQWLVDTYNDVPFFEAFQGNKNLQPKYDKAEVVYKELGILLDSAITIINTAKAQTVDDKKPIKILATSDPLFKGDMDLWKRFANTLKLRLMLRAGSKVTFDKTTFDAIGFITDDVLVNPGYAKVDGKQNPQWDNFAYSAANSARTVGQQHVPTPFVLTFYDGTKLVDTGRGKVVYKAWAGTNGATTPKNQLGYQGSDAARGATPNTWYIGTSATAYTSIGIYKGPDAGQPLMLAAEGYLLQAEGIVRGLITGDAKTAFNKGIEMSFRYLYKNAANSVSVGRDPAKSAADYIKNNQLSYLANFDQASTTDQKVEAIITQKYVALNMINSQEAWFEFLRTGYPRIVNGSTNAKETFAAMTSEATTPTKLPNRILYPESEFRYNQNNVPRNVSPFSNKIFWAL